MASQESGHIGKERSGEEEKKDDGLPQVEETKEVAQNRRKGAAQDSSVSGGAAANVNDDDVTDDSFKNTNLSLMPEDVDNSKLAAALPETKAKIGMQAKNLKIVN